MTAEQFCPQPTLDMPKKALQQQLSELHDELASAADLDPALRQQLRDVADDIETLLGEEAAPPTATAGEHLQERVQHATVEFEAEYPRLARILGDVADTLAKLGI
jgi:hypothetical protein